MLYKGTMQIVPNFINTYKFKTGTLNKVHLDKGLMMEMGGFRLEVVGVKVVGCVKGISCRKRGLTVDKGERE
jgi:hypothetical protein